MIGFVTYTSTILQVLIEDRIRSFLFDKMMLLELYQTKRSEIKKFVESGENLSENSIWYTEFVKGLESESPSGSDGILKMYLLAAAFDKDFDPATIDDLTNDGWVLKSKKKLFDRFNFIFRETAGVLSRYDPKTQTIAKEDKTKIMQSEETNDKFWAEQFETIKKTSSLKDYKFWLALHEATLKAIQKKLDALSGTKDEIVNANPQIKELKNNYLNNKKFAELVEEHKKALMKDIEENTEATNKIQKSIDSVKAILDTAKDRIDQQRKITEIMKEIMETIN